MIRTRHFNMLIVQFLQTRETIAADTEMFFFSFFFEIKVSWSNLFYNIEMKLNWSS